MSTFNKNKRTVSQNAVTTKIAASHAASLVQPDQECATTTFDGNVVSMTDNELVMMNTAGERHSHTLAKDARLTCDGTACQANELKAGRKIRVTTTKDDRNVATGVESLDKNAEFAQCGLRTTVVI